MKYHALNGVSKQLVIIIESLSIIETQSFVSKIRATASGLLRCLGEFYISF